MSRWRNLPPEILDIVFKYVNTNVITGCPHLSECALTCRHWKIPAQREFFRKLLVLTDKDFHEAIRIFSRDDYYLGMNVRELYYGGSYDENTINVIFPRLARIEYDVFNIILKEKFDWLKQLPRPRNTEEGILYKECALMFKKQLNHIHITDHPTSTGDYNFVSQLYEFSSLNSIDVIIRGRSDHPKSLWNYIEHTISPSIRGNLTKACLYLCAPDYNILIQSEVFGRITPSHKLKVLDLTTGRAILNDRFNLLYIMAKFPSVNRLSISCNAWTERSSNGPSASTAMTVRFLKYIFELPGSSNVEKIIIKSEHATKVLRQFCKAIKIITMEDPRLIIRIRNVPPVRYDELDLYRFATIDFCTRNGEENRMNLDFGFGSNDQMVSTYLDFREEVRPLLLQKPNCRLQLDSSFLTQ